MEPLPTYIESRRLLEGGQLLNPFASDLQSLLDKYFWSDRATISVVFAFYFYSIYKALLLSATHIVQDVVYAYERGE